METCSKQLFFLKAILNSFADSTELKINYHKSNMYPINVSEEKMHILSKTFQWQVGAMPFTCLGLPMGLTKPKVEAFLPMIQRIERRMASTSHFLSQVGRLQMVNAVFSSLPMYYMCTFRLPMTVIKKIDKYKLHFLWRGADINVKSHHKQRVGQSSREEWVCLTCQSKMKRSSWKTFTKRLTGWISHGWILSRTTIIRMRRCRFPKGLGRSGWRVS